MEILNNTTFSKCKNLESRPLEINFSDGKGSQRVEPNQIFFVDEKRLENDKLAKSQFESFTELKKLRVLEKGLENI